MHILRHTFCSHLAMRGAPARAIQELAGHQDLATTQRYMHLSPAAIEGAIRLLDEPVTQRTLRGEIVEAAGTGDLKSLDYRSELSGGGGGSRTRVRKHVVEGLYMRIRS